MLGYINTIEKFKATQTSTIVSQLKTIHPNTEQSQINSWDVLINDIKSCVAINNFNKDVLIGIEYFLSVDGMSIDAFFLGKDTNGKNSIYIIESKQWSDDYITENEFSKYREENRLLHPQVQVSKYQKAIKHYLDIGKRIDNIMSFVFIRNASDEGCRTLVELNTDATSYHIPVLNKLNDILSYIATELPSPSNIEIQELQEATYFPSQSIIDSMESIVKREPPFILNQEQEAAVVKILDAIMNGKKLIRITGAAGSGKTAILLNIYVRMLQKRSKYTPYFVSGAQNTALYRDLYPDVAHSFNYTLNLAKNIVRSRVSDPIILLDEAQHNQPGIITELLSLNSIIILCYDEWQAINAHNPLQELEELEKSVNFTTIALKDSVRFNGSTVFESNVTQLLKGNPNLVEDDKYSFGIYKSLNDIKNKTYEIISEHPEATVAVVGLLSDDAKETTDASNGFIFTHWANKIESNWITYIRNKNYLSQFNGSLWVGTWWLPGLDVDYIIVIGGNDAILTKDGFIGNPYHSKNYSMMISIAEDMNLPKTITSVGSKPDIVRNILTYLEQPQNKSLKAEFNKQFSLYLRNMYYILLTRGSKGCYMYFKNDELN